jgi:hypothetical protein
MFEEDVPVAEIEMQACGAPAGLLFLTVVFTVPSHCQVKITRSELDAFCLYLTYAVFVVSIRLVQGPDMAIHQPDSVLDNMNDWCKEHHGASGLTEKVRSSTVDMQEAQKQVGFFVISASVWVMFCITV